MKFERGESVHRFGLLPAALLLAVQMTTASGGEALTSLNIEMSGVDLRPAFTNWGLPIRHQGARGTCSVFALTGAMEYALAHENQQGTVLSVEFLNWASNRATTNAYDGGFFSDLWAGYRAFGVCPETDLPYRQDFDAHLVPDAAVLQKARVLTGSALRLHWIKAWDVRTGLGDEQFREIKRVLSRRWPVCGGLRWPKEERWKEGVLQMEPPEAVFDGHSVLLVGFRNDPGQPGGGLFLIRNSGGGAADGALPFDYVRTYMNDGVWIDHETKTAR